MGDQALWRILAVRSHGAVDLLQAADSRYRGERFKRFGVINDPDCTQANESDQYGLWLDNCPHEDVTGPIGEPVGIVGLRRFKNSEFRPEGVGPSEVSHFPDPAKLELSIPYRCGLRLLPCGL